MTKTAHRSRELTAISEEFESAGRGPEVISKGIIGHGHPDPGGKSYGLLQFTSKASWTDKKGHVHSKVGGTVQAFVNSPDCKAWKDEFNGLTPGSAKFDDAWRNVAARHADEFADAQRSYAVRHYHEPQTKLIQERTGLDLSKRSLSCNGEVFSTAIQHGPNTNIVVQAVEKASRAEHKRVDQLTDGQIIHAITKERALHAQADLGPRYEREANFVLDRLEKETGEHFPRSTTHHTTLHHPKSDHATEGRHAVHGKRDSLVEPDLKPQVLERELHVEGRISPPMEGTSNDQKIPPTSTPELRAQALSLSDVQDAPLTQTAAASELVQSAGMEVVKAVLGQNDHADLKQRPTEIKSGDGAGRSMDPTERNRRGVADWVGGMRD
jgi:hypothetical protein